MKRKKFENKSERKHQVTILSWLKRTRRVLEFCVQCFYRKSCLLNAEVLTTRSDSEEQRGMMGAPQEDQLATPANKTSKDVYFCMLPDKYEPLIEEEGGEETTEERRKRKEERKRKRKSKYKKYRRNVRKALSFSWRCLVAGLQSMASAYSTPLSAAVVVAAETQRAATSNA